MAKQKKTRTKNKQFKNKQDRKQTGQETNRTEKKTIQKNISELCLLTSLYIHPLAGLAGDTLPLHRTTAPTAASETLVQLAVAKGVAHHLTITISITIVILLKMERE